MILETTSFASRPGPGKAAYLLERFVESLGPQNLASTASPNRNYGHDKRNSHAQQFPRTDTAIDVLNDPIFRQSFANFDRRNNIIAANDVGPQMKLVHWRRLEQLGYLRNFGNSSAEEAPSSIVDLERPKSRPLW
jgi:hypothetical protein